MSTSLGNKSTEIPESGAELLTYLEQEARQHRNVARLKSGISHILFWIAIISTYITTVSVSAGKTIDPVVLAIFTALPGVVLLINNTFKYSSGANWNRLKQRKLESLYFRLKFGRISVSETTDELITALEKLDELRVQLEAPPTN